MLKKAPVANLKNMMSIIMLLTNLAHLTLPAAYFNHNTAVPIAFPSSTAFSAAHQGAAAFRPRLRLRASLNLLHFCTVALKVHRLPAVLVARIQNLHRIPRPRGIICIYY
jgi:hypothetical protein